MLRRVVVTGMGGISALGKDWTTIKAGLQSCKNKVIRMNDWQRYDELNTKLAAPILDYSAPNHWMTNLSKMGAWVWHVVLPQAVHLISAILVNWYIVAILQILMLIPMFG